jgi:hypothetical protein
MSKKKGKTAPKKAPKKKAKKKKSAAASRLSAGAALNGGGTTSQITIYLFKTGAGNKIRTTPQRAYAGPGHVEWTVVNLVDGTDVPVRLTWPNGSPWDQPELTIRNWNRVSAEGVKPGVYKYVVHALDAQEDPEIEFPLN